jgi:hypothetical protein
LACENLQEAQARYDQGRISLAQLEEARREENSRWIEYLDVKLEKESWLVTPHAKTRCSPFAVSRRAVA